MEMGSSANHHLNEVMRDQHQSTDTARLEQEHRAHARTAAVAHKRSLHDVVEKKEKRGMRIPLIVGVLSVVLAGLSVIGAVTASAQIDTRSQYGGTTAAVVDDKGNLRVPVLTR
jgi:hypothetical protein